MNLDVVNMEGSGRLFILKDNLCVHTWLEIVEDLAVHVLLRSLFIDQSLRCIFPTERNVVPSPLKPVAIILTTPTISSIPANITLFNT